MTKHFKPITIGETSKVSASVTANVDKQWEKRQAKALSYAHGVKATGDYPETYHNVTLEMEIRAEREDAITTRATKVDEMIVATAELATTIDSTRTKPRESLAYFNRSGNELFSGYLDQHEINLKQQREAQADADIINQRFLLGRSAQHNRYEAAIWKAVMGAGMETGLATVVQFGAGYSIFQAIGLSAASSIWNTGVAGAATGWILLKKSSSKNSPKRHRYWAVLTALVLLFTLVLNLMLGHYRGTGDWAIAMANFVKNPLMMPDVMGWAMTIIGLAWATMWLTVFYRAGDPIFDYGDAKNRKSEADINIAENRAKCRSGLQALAQQSLNEVEDAKKKFPSDVAELERNIIKSEAAAESCEEMIKDVTHRYIALIWRLRDALRGVWIDKAPAFLSDEIKFDDVKITFPSLKEAKAKHRQFTKQIKGHKDDCDKTMDDINGQLNKMLKRVDDDMAGD